jgi:predicted DNA-binding transcriptional regulator YafY
VSPAAAATAEAQLLRLLWLIPAAARPGGVALEVAAERLGVPVSQLHKDVQALTDREFYLPAGAAEGLEITLTDRLEVHDKGMFHRPPRLTPRELVCVLLGLRLQGSAPPELLEALEGKLAFPAEAPHPGPVAFPQLEDGGRPGAALATLRRGWADRRLCVFGYLKPGADAPEVRRLHCWALVHAEGRWYASGHDPDSGGLRNFRVDRMLEVELEGEEAAYEIPPDFDPATVLDGARLFQPPAREPAGPASVTVRYSPRVTPWVREEWRGTEDRDGGYRVQHPVGDPGWVIRHVLQYGPDAEVLEPLEMRDAVRSAVEGMAHR